MVVEGNVATATPYEQYFNGGNAIAENLFKVGDYQDVQSVIDGGVTRKVGIKVLDGSETWSIGSGTYPFFRSGSILQSVSSFDFYCSHFTSTNISGSNNNQGIRIYQSNLFFRYDELYPATSENIPLFQQWLSDQYNAGTPVVLVYPTSSPVTEQVAPQSLTIQQGTNIIKITEASIDNLALEVKYKAGVSVTIQEVTSANLDNSVQVTIG